MLTVKNQGAKSTPPKTVITFGDSEQQGNFTKYLEDMAWDLNGSKFINMNVEKIGDNGALYFELPGINGIKKIVLAPRIGATSVPADPISAVAVAVSDVAKLSGQIIGWIQSGRARKDEMADIDVETTALEPLVATLFNTYPFVAAQYQGERQRIVNEIENARGKKKNPFFKQLNSLLKSVIESVKPYSKMLQNIEWVTNTPVTPVDFSVQFAEYFAKNPTPQMIAEAKAKAEAEAKAKQNTGTSLFSTKTDSASSSNGFIKPLLLLGGSYMAYKALYSKKKSKKKK